MLSAALVVARKRYADMRFVQRHRGPPTWVFASVSALIPGPYCALPPVEGIEPPVVPWRTVTVDVDDQPTIERVKPDVAWIGSVRTVAPGVRRDSTLLKCPCHVGAWRQTE